MNFTYALIEISLEAWTEIRNKLLADGHVEQMHALAIPTECLATYDLTLRVWKETPTP